MILVPRKKIRLHQNDPGPTIEGILAGKPWRHAGHYVIKKPAVVQAPEQTIALDGSAEVWVPREKVIFLEVIR